MGDVHPSLALVENNLWVASAPTGMPAYDFEFERFFACRHPYQREEVVTAVARMGAATDYEERHRRLLNEGVRLIHTPEQYRLSSELPHWYPLLEDLTARSAWFDPNSPPTAEEIGSRFGWPVFAKGARQTSKHQRRLSVLENSEEFNRAMEEWRDDPILWWQQIVYREHLDLRPVAEASTHALPPVFEFRSFWWHGKCVGVGRYWTAYDYDMNREERSAALAIGAEAAKRVNVPFLVVDLAQKRDGAWVVIECDDGQDAGYAGVTPMLMWRRVLDAKRG